MTRPHRRSFAVAFVVVVVAFGAIYMRRVASGFSNVDDYLYALQTRSYLGGLRGGPGGLMSSWQDYGRNSPLVPMAALPIAVFSKNPNALVLVQFLAVVGLLFACWGLLSQLRPAGSAHWATAAVVVCLPPVLGYAAMLHFAVATTACCVGALAAYLASQRLRLLGPTLLFGLVLGLLGISRVVAPVYVAALVAAATLDMLSDRRDISLRVKRCAFAVAVAVLVAGPWWLLNARSAFQWLGMGYDASSGFAEPKSPVRQLQDRLTHTAAETGWLLAVAIFALMCLAVFYALRVRNRPVLVSSAVVALGFLALATSSNAGTAFGLPFVVIGACIAASRLAWRARPAVVVALVLVATVVLPSSSLVGLDRTLWVSGTPGEEQAKGALGCDCRPPDTDRLNREVLDYIVGPALIVRDDALVNANAIRFNQRRSVSLLALGYGERAVPPSLLAQARTVLTGSTQAPYHSQVDFAELDRQLRSAGFVPSWRRRLSPGNEVVVWLRPN